MKELTAELIHQHSYKSAIGESEFDRDKSDIAFWARTGFRLKLNAILPDALARLISSSVKSARVDQMRVRAAFLACHSLLAWVGTDQDREGRGWVRIQPRRAIVGAYRAKYRKMWLDNRWIQRGGLWQRGICDWILLALWLAWAWFGLAAALRIENDSIRGLMVLSVIANLVAVPIAIGLLVKVSKKD